jgi:spore maturation protein CgeB
MNLVALGISPALGGALLREFAARGHSVLDLHGEGESSVVAGSNLRREIFSGVADLQKRFADAVRNADAVLVGSDLSDGIEIGEWINSEAKYITAFYDFDAPATLAALKDDGVDYISPELISRYQLYLSASGGPTLERLEREFNSPMARALYFYADPQKFFPEDTPKKWNLGFLGMYHTDRQPALQSFMLDASRQLPREKFVVAGRQYPPAILWPENIERLDHLPPDRHVRFFNEQVFTLNITREHCIEAGYSPSARLFQAAACGTPVICDSWDGLEEFFELGDEILIAYSGAEVVHYLQSISETEAREIGAQARKRVLAQHTAAHRAEELENYFLELRGERARPELNPTEQVASDE